jgi:hypothetical protein
MTCICMTIGVSVLLNYNNLITFKTGLHFMFENFPSILTGLPFTFHLLIVQTYKSSQNMYKNKLWDKTLICYLKHEKFRKVGFTTSTVLHKLAGISTLVLLPRSLVCILM